MTDEERQPAYIAYCRTCKAMVGASVDKLDHRNDVADFAAEYIRAGYYVQRGIVGHARHDQTFGTCKCPQIEENV